MSDAFTTVDTLLFIGTVLESSLYGLYCVAFAVHARIRSKHKGGGINIAIYPLSVLFTLCTIYCAIDTAQTLFTLRFQGSSDPQAGLTSYNMNIANTAMYCAITFIAQGILIYRCWLMWGRQTLVISIPTILAWLSFGTSLAMIAALIAPSGSDKVPGTTTSWFFSLSTAAFSASLGVNAIVATLLAIRIYQNQQIAKESFTVKKRTVHPIRRIISIFNDSGMLMLGCQIIWLTFFRLNSVGFVLIKGPIVMIYGLTPTLIYQRAQAPLVHTSSKEKPRNDRSTSVRFAIWTWREEGVGVGGITCNAFYVLVFFFGFFLFLPRNKHTHSPEFYNNNNLLCVKKAITVRPHYCVGEKICFFATVATKTTYYLLRSFLFCFLPFIIFVLTSLLSTIAGGLLVYLL